MKQFINSLLSWKALAIEGCLLMWICWPWANHWVSYFWGIVFLAVLIGEFLSKLFSPEKQTVSNNIQDESKNDPIRFWIVIFVWLFFAFSLAGHFCVKLL